MSASPNNKFDDQEIDMNNISKSIRKAAQGLNAFIFSCIQFVVRNIIIFAILCIVGAVLGYLMDKTQKAYDHQIVVSPNFGSTDYLYAKVELINSKIAERDTVFLKSIGIIDPSSLTQIKIKPIIDIYRFVNNNEQNYKLLELLAEDNDILKIVEDEETSKNFTYHTISFSTKKITTIQKTVVPLMKYFNDNEYYTVMQQQFTRNTVAKMQANDVIITQIDNILNEFSSGATQTRLGNPNLVYYNENSNLNDVLKTKNELTDEQGKHRIDLISQSKVVKDISNISNIKNNKSINGKMKFILPILFCFFFILIFLFRSFYKYQKNKTITN